MNSKTKRILLFILVSVVISILFTFAVELYANRNTFSVEKDKQVIDLKDYISETTNFSEKDGVLQSPIFDGDGKIKIEGLNNVYIGKINIIYESIDNFGLNIVINDKNGYVKTVGGSVSSKLKLISENVNHKTDSLEINSNSKGFKITSITATNLFAFNTRRMFFSFIFLEVIFMIVFFRKFLIKNLQYAFLLIVLTLGTGIIYSQPPVSWVSLDDEVHFKIAYGIFHPGYQKVSRTVKELSTAYPFAFPLGTISSIDELRAQGEYLNSNHIDGEYASMRPLSFSYSQIAYVPMATMLKIGTTLNLPFTWLYRLGKFGTLLTYALLGFFAIRKAKIGKKLLFVVALIPTNVFLAAQFSYDPMVTGGTMLFFSYLTNIWSRRDEKLEIKDYAVMLGSFLLFSLTKAVYSLFFLMLLLLPASKFRSKKQHVLFKTSVGVICFLMLSTFVLPMLVAPPDGDIRGSVLVDSAKQFAFIFREPLVYTKILLTNVKVSLVHLFTSPLTLTTYGYLGSSRRLFTIPLLLLLILTGLSSVENKKYELDTKYKVAIVLNVTAIIMFIWTALYISFTVLESTVIGGVQGRYYLPFFFPLLLCLGSKRISKVLNKDIYVYIIMLSIFILNFVLIYMFILRAVAL